MRIGELVDCVSDRVNHPGPGWIGLEHLVADQLRVHGSADVPAGRGRAFKAGDVLFSGLRPSQARVALASSAGVCSPEILVLRARTIPPALALAALAHPQTTAAAAQLAHGTRMPRIRWPALRELPAPLPPQRHWQTTARAMQALTTRLEILHAQDRAAATLLGAAVAAELGGAVVDGPRLGSILSHRGGAAPRGSLAAHTPCIGLGDLPRDGLAVHAPARSPGSGSWMPIDAGDLLLPLLRPGTARLGVAPRSGAASAEIFAAEADPDWAVAVVGWLLLPGTRARWEQLATGTRMPRLRRDDMLQTRLPVGLAAARRLSALRPLLQRALTAPAQASALRALQRRVMLGRPVPRDPRPPAG